MAWRLLLLDFPILAKFRIKRFSLFAGPNFLIRLGNCQANWKDDYAGIDEDTDIDDENLKNFSMGLIFGFDYAFPVGSGNLIIDVRYNFVFNSFFDGVFSDAKTNSIIISLGYGFSTRSNEKEYDVEY